MLSSEWRLSAGQKSEKPSEADEDVGDRDLTVTENAECVQRAGSTGAWQLRGQDLAKRER